jgi:hypothetical protein
MRIAVILPARVAGGFFVHNIRVVAACLLGSAFLSGCASLNALHDPQTGLISRELIPHFLKSVRCEMATFYEANAYRRVIFETNIVESARLASRAVKLHSADFALQAQAARDQAIQEGSNFPISPQLFGGVFLDLKVLDTLGAGAGDTNIVNKQVRDATHNVTWGISPTLNTQNTYEMNTSFLMDQSAGVSRSRQDDDFKCYGPAGYEPGVSPVALAEDSVQGAAQFTRILVNGSRPLAAWLLDNSNQAWVNFHARNQGDEREQLIPVQMNYAFTVQVTAGLNVRYTLTAPIWSPAQIGATASSVQTSLLSLYLNGDDANLAGGVKLGQAVNANVKSPPFVPIGQIGRGSRRENEAAVKKLDSTISALEETLKAPTTSGEKPLIANEAARGRLEAQLEGLKQLRRTLTAPRPAPLPATENIGVGVGNKRGYLNAPVGIAPPP